MIGILIVISAVLFFLAIVITQILFINSRFNRFSYFWIGISILGLVVALLGAIITGLLSIFVFNLDVLQNSQHGVIASCVIITVFGAILIVFQLYILQRRVSIPILQAFMNVIFGTATWLFLASQVAKYQTMTLGFPLFLLISVLSGVILGAIIHGILNSFLS
jgi:hypothetical protein